MENSKFVTSGNAAWLVGIIFTILAMLFGGCRNYAPEGDFVIDEIVVRETMLSYCNYYIKDDDLVFVDSCGKWNIGDTITIKW